MSGNPSFTSDWWIWDNITSLVKEQLFSIKSRHVECEGGGTIDFVSGLVKLLLSNFIGVLLFEMSISNVYKIIHLLINYAIFMFFDMLKM